MQALRKKEIRISNLTITYQIKNYPNENELLEMPNKVDNENELTETNNSNIINQSNKDKISN